MKKSSREANQNHNFLDLCKKAKQPNAICGVYSELSGSTKDKMEQLYDYVVSKRSTVQDMLKDADVVVSDSRPKFNNNPSLSSQYTRFNIPSRYENCRICKQLDLIGDIDGIYKDHFTNNPYGCPRFAAMTISERKSIALKCRICLFCLDPDYIHKRLERHQNCPAFNNRSATPNTINCSQCRNHFLICDIHASENQDKLDNCLQFWTSKGKDFSCTTVTMSVSQSPCPEPVTPDSSPAPVSVHIRNERDISESIENLKQFAKGSEVVDVPVGQP